MLYEGYISSSDDNTCLDREEFEELEQFENCLELKFENGKYVCTRCKPQYSLLEVDNEVKCTYIPTLFDYNFKIHYNVHYFQDVFNRKYTEFMNFKSNDYFYRASIYLPCKEAINLGTDKIPYIHALNVIMFVAMKYMITFYMMIIFLILIIMLMILILPLIILPIIIISLLK